MKRLVVLVSVLLLVALAAGVLQAVPVTPGKGWYPDIPLEKSPTWHYIVRLWEYDFAAGELHELTAEDFAALGESQSQTVTVLRYDQPNPYDTIFGIYHSELNFVLWMQRFPDKKGQVGELAQIGETAKDVYDPALTPAENDAAGNIDWFQADGVWYPRTWTKRISYPGQTWSELWGPFDGAFLQRNYKVSFVMVPWQGKKQLATKVTITGPAEGDPTSLATEAYTFIDRVGMYERYFDLTIFPMPGMPGIMVFKHVATLQSVEFPG